MGEKKTKILSKVVNTFMGNKYGTKHETITVYCNTIFKLCFCSEGAMFDKIALIYCTLGDLNEILDK